MEETEGWKERGGGGGNHSLHVSIINPDLLCITTCTIVSSFVIAYKEGKEEQKGDWKLPCACVYVQCIIHLRLINNQKLYVVCYVELDSFFSV